MLIEQNKTALEFFLKWMVSITKQDHSIPVFMASNEEFFVKWIGTKLNCLYQPITIGDLPKKEALNYFTVNKPDNFPFSFESLYSITGILFVF